MNKKNVSLIVFASAAIFSHVALATTIAQDLGWKSTSSSKNNLCGGYYSQPLFITRTPNPPPFKTVPVTITSKGPAVFRSNGVSILQKDVLLKQPGRIIHADKAFIYHNSKTGKLTDIKFVGHVRIQEMGKLLVGHNADYDISKNTLTIHHAAYHIAGKYDLLNISTPFNAWGSAEKAFRHANGDIDLTNAQYSTCSPQHPSWIISAKKLELDKTKEEGYAHNVVLRFKHVPIFYSPYYSFPLNASRKTGFLVPLFGFSKTNGFSVTEPYYWNMAPNYDFLFTPEWYAKRGAQLTGSFRYLTATSDGVWDASIVPHDSQFKTEQQNLLNNNINSTVPDIAPYLSELENSSATRAFFNIENNFQWNDFWSAKVHARYVTDPYYVTDYQTEYFTQTTNQLPSFAELSYAGDHWNDTFLIQGYQTLHTINQLGVGGTPAYNQYTRLPEWDFTATYPQFLSGLNFNLNGQAVHFDYNSAYLPYTYQMPIGNRMHLQPSISRPFNWASFYLTPQLTGDMTGYDSQLATASANEPRMNFDKSRALPIFNIDSGLFFNRFTSIGGKKYIETLDPRIFYLYTPYLNQNSFPVFDTQLLPFSIANLYSLNEFSGFDRLQNANQISLGLTSHLLRESDGSNVLTAEIGAIDYFEKQRVCLLSSGCQPSNESLSPIAGDLTWNPNSMWSVSTQAAWDTVLKQINNAQAGVNYTFNSNHIVVLNYQFVHGNPQTNPLAGFSPDTSLLTAGLVWPVTQRWGFFGYTYYDLTNNHAQNQYVGLSYNSCCWALRFIVSQDWNGATQISGGKKFQSSYNNTYYLEFLLKGLGSVGFNHAKNMLTNTLPGFSDIFSNNGHYGYGQGV